MTITVQPQPDGTAVLLWDGSPVAQMRAFHQEWEGVAADGWELMTHGGLHLSALEPQTLIDELSDRIEVKLGLRPPLVSVFPEDWEQIKEGWEQR